MKKSKRLIPYIIISIFSILLLYRCFYGIDNGDEGFYISLAHRLYMGEALLVEEWYPAQLFAIFLLPLYKIFCFFIPSGEGIVLFFRIVSLFIKMTCTFIVYIAMIKRNKNQWVALVAGLLFLVYERDNILNLSYYYIGMVMSFMAGLLLYCMNRYSSEKKQYVFSLFSGICFAIATVSNPYLAIVYFIGIIYLIIKSRQKQVNSKIIWYNMAGVFIITLIFMLFVFQRANITEIISNVPFMLNDPTHPPKFLPYEFARWFWIIIEEYGWVSIIISTVSIIYLVVMRCLEGSISTWSKQGIILVNCLTFIYNIICSINQNGLVLIAISILGLVCYFLTDNRDKKLFIWIYCLGIGVSFAFSFASDTGITAVIIGFAISAVAAVFFCDMFIREFLMQISNKRKRIYRMIEVISLLIVLFLSTYMRMANVWRDYAIPELVYQTDEGPNKFIFTNSQRGERNAVLVKDLKYINSLVQPESRVLITRFLPWGYCCINCKVGSYTVWKVDFNSEQQKHYYDINQDKIPDYIFVVKAGYGRYNENNLITGYLADYMEQEGYGLQELDSGILYTRE